MRANRRFLGNSASVTLDPCALMSTAEELLNSAGGQAAAVVDEDLTSWSSVGAYTSLIGAGGGNVLLIGAKILRSYANIGRPVVSAVDPADPKLGKIELVGRVLEEVQNARVCPGITLVDVHGTATQQLALAFQRQVMTALSRGWPGHKKAAGGCPTA